MSNSSVDLASLLCSRLCHDLLSPVGALVNGLELLADEKDPEMRQRCFELLEQSARTSTDKLKFFRLAFGAAGGFGESVAAEEVRSLVDALVAANDRISVTWVLGVAEMSKPAAKVLLNFAQIAIDALVRGGEIDIAAEVRGGTSELAVRAMGPKIAFDEAIGRALDGSMPEEELTSRTAAAHMLHVLAQESGGGLQYAVTGEALVMGAVLPEG
ncbi:histidine phosphotransferase [Croceicoccus estronivorus]|uniref:histidine phosphotransferase family protein n=1 Tax=Croceicoccus estronivorus TaxID=1172626 RepID=UPI0008360587|nr:histidine phosphotransferase family protein [Croceicoccus estronivorus]OCC25271.1 histidine phosphotransferase [Croceicoccus estronivorus]